jgi:hypothetical protein
MEVKSHQPFPIVNINECIPINTLKYRFHAQDINNRVGSLKKIIHHQAQARKNKPNMDLPLTATAADNP